MNKLKFIIALSFLSLILVQCSHENQFLIAKNRVGKISNIDTVADLETIFAKDSIVSHLSEGALGSADSRFTQDNDEYLIYSKEGKHLLTIVPKTPQDSTSTFKYIDVFDNQFKTQKELSIQSLFKEINLNYMINKVESSFSSAILYIDELNATISIDKKELGLNTFDTNEVKIAQIPELAKIKSMTIWFD